MLAFRTVTYCTENEETPVPLGSLGYALHSRRDDLRPLVSTLHGLAAQHADFTVASSAF